MSKLRKKKPVLSSNLFPVVGIGASAGGLEAFKQLIKSIPPNSGMAYVLVQHLDPSHASLLPDLLQKITPIPVIEISNDITVKPDHIYIIPSNKMLVANDGVLELTPRPDKSEGIKNLPIDIFFQSLAGVHQAHAIGVVLSGTASDGTEGLRAIKEKGGMTFAQDQQSASYDGMPLSAVQAGVVDHVLPPHEIPLKIIELAVQYPVVFPGIDNTTDPGVLITEILHLLRQHKGTDFTFYKKGTIQRRLALRMALSGNETISDYLSFVQEHISELDLLYQSLLIPVTAFFRDGKTFERLSDSVLPLIINNRKNDEPVRVWVAGCSAGQEAYSIAICIKELLAERTLKVQIFGTDISAPAISKARSGKYAKSELQGLSTKRIKNFFSSLNGSYQVVKEIREMCVFAHHDFLLDPPFGRMDLISCRNVLIYMESYLQQKALSSFHYALKENGFLLLGNSESIKTATEIFNVYDPTVKIFHRKENGEKFILPPNPRIVHGIKNEDAIAIEGRPHSFQKSIDDIILQRLSPVAVVVNENMDIVYFRGNTGLYLQPSEGKPSHNLSRMSKKGLAFELRSLIHKAKTNNKATSKKNIPLIEDGIHRYVSLEAVPMTNTPEPHYLIFFQDGNNKENIKTGTGPKAKGSALAKEEEYTLRTQQLEQELVQTREDMRAVTEHQEAAHSELQSANELQSTGEELQSLNDELETSKEELQNTNEELQVLNQALTAANQLAMQSRDSAEAIVSTVRTPLIVLDKHLRIKSANTSFYSLFQLTPQTTENKLIYDIGSKEWHIPSLQRLLEQILPEKKNLHDYEVAMAFPARGSRIMLLNAMVLVSEGTDDLILLSMEDISDAVAFRTSEKEFQRQLEEKIQVRTQELNLANAELQQKNQEIALSMYNKRFLQDFAERFSTNQLHLEFFNSVVLYIADLVKLDYVMIGKLTPGGASGITMTSIAICAFGKLTENIELAFPVIVGEQGAETMVYNFPRDCKRNFPGNNMLNHYEVEGYIAYPLYGPLGTVIGVLAVMHRSNIKDPETVMSILKIVAKRAEIELERITIEEQLVNNNKKLAQQNEDLSKLNKELESFTHISSHDLQEPLRKIQTFTNKIIESDEDRLSEIGKDYFSKIKQASGRMQALLEDLLMYSKANIADRVYEDIDLNVIVEEAFMELSELIKEKNAAIEKKDLCHATINAFQFRQVMINLIGNALKFSKSDVPPNITISSRIIDGSEFETENRDLPSAHLMRWKKYCHISVVDNGIGFDQKYSEQIFEVFERLYGKDEYPGTGMGLAIVKKIIINHDGMVKATGHAGKGAIFDIFIPHER